MKIVILYHVRDFDGMGSAYVAHKYLSERMSDTPIIFEPFDYGWKLPETIEQGDVVYMLDVSEKPEVMFDLQKKCSLFVWIDHHITAIRAWDNFCAANGISPDSLEGLRINGTAGIELCWQYFFNTELPPIVRLLGRYDVWDESQTDWDTTILPFQFGMKIYDMTPGKPDAMEHWEYLLFGSEAVTSDLVTRRVVEGNTVLKYIHGTNVWYNKKYGAPIKFILPNATPEQQAFLDSFTCYASNTGMKNSMSFQNFIDTDAYDVYCAYAHTTEGIEFSVYNANKRVNVSEIAVLFGGGGHIGAAGFMLDHLPFEFLERT